MADQKVREMEPVETQIVEIMPPDIENLIYVVRNKQVMVDSDLAMLYQVETGALNRAVKRNIARFPEDFRFQLTKDEYENLKCQFGTSNGSGTENGYGGRRTLPYVFTEQGISMLASVLHSEVAINVSIGIMRAFVEMRRFIANNALLFERISNTAHDKSGAKITGTCTFDSDTSEDTAAVAEILVGKTAHARGSKLTGTMKNNGAVKGVISTVAGEYTVPQGYHDGSGKVSIDATEQAKLIATNIREGVTILGVEGAMSGSEDMKPQSKEVTPSKEAHTIMPDEEYNCLSQVTVKAIPYVETDNSAGGKTVTIG